MTNTETILEKLFALGNSYWLTRFVILRLLGFVYAVAFLVAANQLVPLIGQHGLTPATHFLNRGSNAARFTKRRYVSDAYSVLVRNFRRCIIGLLLGRVRAVAHCPRRVGNAILLAVLWAMYMSIVHIGQIWYGYGWEIQLLETDSYRFFFVHCSMAGRSPSPGRRSW